MTDQPAVIYIEERKLRTGMEFQLNGYVCYWTDKIVSIHACSGVVTYMNETLASSLIECDCAKLVKVVVDYSGKEYTVVNTYVRDKLDVDRILYFVDKKKRCIACGDFNTRHTLLGAERLNSNGRLFERFLEEAALIVVNDTSPTR